MAGYSKIKITPPLETPLGGNVRDKGSQGVHDDIYVKALVLSTGKKEIALVSCALVAVTKAMVESIRQTAEKRCGIPEENILICAFHTHSGPATGAIFEEVNKSYLNSFPEIIASSICKAKENLKKVRIRFASGEEKALPHNRRMKMKNGTLRMNWEDLPLDDIDKPAGPVDPGLGVIVIEELNGRMMAVLINYTCHPAILAGDNFLISEDYPGYTMRLLEKETNALCLFTNGATGNINHINIFNPHQKRGFYEAERLGTILAKKVLSIIPKGKAISVEELKIEREEIKLPLRKIPRSEVEKARKLVQERKTKKISLIDGLSEEVYAEQILSLSKIGRESLSSEIDGLSEEVYAEQILSLSKIGRESLSSEIQVVSLGDVAFVGIPGELFVEYGLEIKKKSPFLHAFIIGYANDYVGYIPTLEAFQEGGYEVKLGLASKLDPKAGEIITGKVLKILNKLKGKEKK
jgi:hypothetical protein